jgi:hypothetical protein
MGVCGVVVIALRMSGVAATGDAGLFESKRSTAVKSGDYAARQKWCQRMGRKFDSQVIHKRDFPPRHTRSPGPVEREKEVVLEQGVTLDRAPGNVAR